jgi:hypothetical protein
MTLLVQCVQLSGNNIKIHEYFMKVEDTSDFLVFKVLIESMKSFDLNIVDIKGQGYDNGSNMKGKIRECKNDCLTLIQEIYICHVFLIVLTLLFVTWLNLVLKLPFFWNCAKDIHIIVWLYQKMGCFA